MLTAFIVILAIFAFLLYFQFIGYPLFMSIYRPGSGKRGGKDRTFSPFISVIVPTYNEAKRIGIRIENLLSQEYPRDRFEIIVVDSGSVDNTVSAAREFEKKYSNVLVIQEEKRNGKASAINFGKKAARGEIVLVTDANTVFSRDVLKEMAPYFADPETGAVGGRFVLTNTENGLVKSSSFYWDIESLMRRGESILDSACLFHGEINAWRKEIVEADCRALSEDLDMAIQIRRRGYRIVYEPKAMAYEPGPTTEKEQIIQKKRTTVGTIQCFFKHKSYLWFPRDKYAAVIFPFHKALQIFSPFLILGYLAAATALLVTQQFTALGISLLILFAITLISFILLNRKLIAVRLPGNTHKRSFSLRGFGDILYYVMLHEYIILLAWKEYIFKQYTVIWQKVESTRT